MPKAEPVGSMAEMRTPAMEVRAGCRAVQGRVQGCAGQSSEQCEEVKDEDAWGGDGEWVAGRERRRCRAGCRIIGKIKPAWIRTLLVTSHGDWAFVQLMRFEHQNQGHKGKHKRWPDWVRGGTSSYKP